MVATPFARWEANITCGMLQEQIPNNDPRRKPPRRSPRLDYNCIRRARYYITLKNSGVAATQWIPFWSIGLYVVPFPFLAQHLCNRRTLLLIQVSQKRSIALIVKTNSYDVNQRLETNQVHIVQQITYHGFL